MLFKLKSVKKKVQTIKNEEYMSDITKHFQKKSKIWFSKKNYILGNLT